MFVINCYSKFSRCWRDEGWLKYLRGINCWYDLTSSPILTFRNILSLGLDWTWVENLKTTSQSNTSSFGLSCISSSSLGPGFVAREKSERAGWNSEKTVERGEPSGGLERGKGDGLLPCLSSLVRSLAAGFARHSKWRACPRAIASPKPPPLLASLADFFRLFRPLRSLVSDYSSRSCTSHVSWDQWRPQREGYKLSPRTPTSFIYTPILPIPHKRCWS